MYKLQLLEPKSSDRYHIECLEFSRNFEGSGKN